MLLEGKNIIITGGSRGIGKGIVKLFAENGANIAFTYRSSDEQARVLEKDLSHLKVKIRAYKSDATCYEKSEIFVQNVLREFGTIDVLVNNAGITRDGLIMRMSEKDFNDVMETNIKSVFNMTKLVVGSMLKAKSGSIINMSSVVGIKGNIGQSNYAASKAAINGFTKSIAQELGSRNIRCNSIAPGFILTEMTESLDPDAIKKWTSNIPLKRGGTVEDIAKASMFLASDLSSYVTGQVINVCGGMLT